MNIISEGVFDEYHFRGCLMSMRSCVEEGNN